MRTVAYVGLAGPFGYDYRHPSDRVNRLDGSSPNPVLENVSGLLICYDEVVFLSRQFCPQDMRELPYVSFLTDDSSARDALSELTSRESVAQLEGEVWDSEEVAQPSWRAFSRVTQIMANGQDFAIDNHTHEVYLSQTSVVTGNSMRASLALLDLSCARLLKDARVDVIIPSPLRPALRSLLPKELDSDYFSPEKRIAASEILGVRSPNFLTPEGSYNEIVEEARQHKRASEFRDYLRESDGDTRDGVTLARLVEDTAISSASQQMERALNGPGKFWTWGVPAARALTNHFLPFVGTGMAGLLNFMRSRNERSELTKAAWAPFVLDLRNQRDRYPRSNA